MYVCFVRHVKTRSKLTSRNTEPVTKISSSHFLCLAGDLICVWVWSSNANLEFFSFIIATHNFPIRCCVVTLRVTVSLQHEMYALMLSCMKIKYCKIKAKSLVS